MEREDVKIGMKVKVLGNSFYINPIELPQVKKGFAYVIRKYDDKVVLGENKDNHYGDSFNYSDIEPFEESLKDKVFQNHVEVELRCGIKTIVVARVLYNEEKDIFFKIDGDVWFDDALKHRSKDRYDIMKATLNGVVIYEREQEKWSDWKRYKTTNFKYRTKGLKIQAKVYGVKGLAICDPSDEYDLDKGFSIAYYRAIKKIAEKELKKLLGE